MGQLKKVIERTLDDNKADNIVTIDLAGKSSFADYMIVASGTSGRHVSALAGHVVTALKKAGFDNVPTEGKEVGDWALIDAGDIVVHIFKPESRAFYNLEKMWAVAIPENHVVAAV